MGVLAYTKTTILYRLSLFSVNLINGVIFFYLLSCFVSLFTIADYLLLEVKRMTQDEMRKIIAALHLKYGTPYSFIAKRLGVSNQTISFFVNGQRNLSSEKQTALAAILQELI